MNAVVGADPGMCDNGLYDHYGYGSDRQTVTVDHQKRQEERGTRGCMIFLKTLCLRELHLA